MPNVFNSVKGLHPRRNAFSAHTYRNDLTAQLGVNIPIYQQHVAPGARVSLSANALVRLQALIAPVMDNIDFYVHFWQIPYRILENDRFTAFIAGEIEAEDYDALFVTPYEIANAIYNLNSDQELTASEVFEMYFGNGSLLDYLGYDSALFPAAEFDSDEGYWKAKSLTGNNKTKFNLRPLIAYYMLHQNWYMNENVPYFNNFVEKVESFFKDQDLDSFAYLYYFTYKTFGTTLLPHGWEKDYFTSALPNVQYGEPVSIALQGPAPVSLNSPLNIVSKFESNNLIFDFANTVTDGQPLYAGAGGTPDLSQKAIYGVGEGDSRPRVNSIINVDINSSDPSKPDGYADLSEASAITINELRVANALQVFKERQMRFGRRRQEYYKGFFDVTPEDFRLQLPKYLGGGRIPINISDIEQTSKTDTSEGLTQALGHLAGKGTAVAGGFAGFTTFCSEESIIIGIAFAMPHITYANSISKFLLKTNDVYDYFNPSFEHLGEQQIDKLEIYAGSSDPDGEFGYTPRFNEYRFHNNEMHGEFKDSLSYWTLGRIFDSQPALNADFIYMQPNVFDRIFAVEGQPSMLVSALFRVRMIQPVSKYGTPRLLV